MKIRPVGVDFFRAEVRKNITKLIVAFRSFANVHQSRNNNNNNNNSWRGIGEVAPFYGVDPALVLTNRGVQ